MDQPALCRFCTITTSTLIHLEQTGIRFSKQMVVRRTSSRRRRVLNDEMVRGDDAAPASATSSVADLPRNRLLAYSSGANRRNQLKTTDLIPKRWLAFSALVVGLVSCVCIINLLAIYAPQISAYIGAEGVEALSITGRGTLANWFTSFLLLAASMASLQIYALRQHRRDDYQGSYRVWTWLAAFFVLVSLDCAIDLRSILGNVFQAVTHRSIENSWVSLAVPAILLTVIAIRSLLEVRTSRLAMASVVLVWLIYSGGIAVQSPWVQQQLAGMPIPIILGNAVLLGTTALLVAHLVYARFVYLHAHGLIEVAKKEVRQAKPKKAKKKTKAKKKSVVEPESELVEQPVAVSKLTKSKKRATTKKEVKSTKEIVSPPPKAKTASQKQKATKKKTASTASSFDELSDLLKSKTSAAKSKSGSVKDNQETESADPNILSMTKAERRRQRKLKKNARKAA